MKERVQQKQNKRKLVVQKYLSIRSASGLMDRLNPIPAPEADVLTEYFARFLLFFFPLFMAYRGITIIPGYTIVDLCFYVLLLVVVVSGFLYHGRIAKSKSVRRKRKSVNRSVIAYVCLLLMLTGVSVFQAITGREGLHHTLLYIGCVILIAGTAQLWSRRVYYFQLFVFSLIPVYFSMYYFVFTAQDVLPGTGQWMQSHPEVAPFLLLGGFISSLLFFIEKETSLTYFYASMSFAAFMLLFLYGGTLSVCLEGFFIATMPVFYQKEESKLKRTFVLLFLLLFAASGAPLISYLDAAGINRSFELKYSIYIDLIICITGLIVSSYYEKVTETQCEAETIRKRNVRRLYRYYWKSFVLVFMILCAGCLFVHDMDENSLLPISKVFYQFFVSLRNAISSSHGEWGYILRRFGVAGVAVLSVCTIAFIRNAGTEDDVPDDAESGLVLIALLFVVQGLFYPLSVMSMPYYALFGALAVQSTPRGQRREQRRNNGGELTK